MTNTNIGASRRDVERPEGAFDNHRLLDVMFHTPSGCETIKKTKNKNFLDFFYCLRRRFMDFMRGL